MAHRPQCGDTDSAMDTEALIASVIDGLHTKGNELEDTIEQRLACHTFKQCDGSVFF